MRKDPTFKRHGVRLPGQELVAARSSLSPIGTVFAPLFRLQAICASILKLPPLACPGTTCSLVEVEVDDAIVVQLRLKS